MFGALDLEVVGRELHRRAAAGTSDCIADRRFDVQVERITPLVGLGGELALVALTGLGNLVFAD